MSTEVIRYNMFAALRHGRQHANPPFANQWSSGRSTGPVAILLHGLGMDSATSWFTLSPLLANSGFRVFSFDYGRYGHGWITRPLRTGGKRLPGMGDATLCADELNQFVDRVLAHTGAEKVSLVGHSFGALVAQYYLLRCGGARYVDHFVGIAATVHGTTFNGLLRVSGAPRIGTWLFGANIVQQAAGSDFLSSLYSNGELAKGVSYTMVSPRWDEFTTPVKAQSINGAVNIRLDGFAEHVLVLYNRRALNHVMAALNSPAR